MTLNARSSKAVLVCAFGLLAAFFMPWVQILGLGVSGYGLGQLGSYGNLAWIDPILAGAVILLSFMGLPNRDIGLVAGFVPLAALGIAIVQLNKSEGAKAVKEALAIAPHVLSIGAWLTIAFSVGIIISAFVGMGRGVQQAQKPKTPQQDEPDRA